MPYIARLYGTRKNSVPITSGRVDLPGREQVRGGERVGGVDPADGREASSSCRVTPTSPYAAWSCPGRAAGMRAACTRSDGEQRVDGRPQERGAHRVREVLERRESDPQSAQVLRRIGEQAGRDHEVVEDRRQRHEHRRRDSRCRHPSPEFRSSRGREDDRRRQPRRTRARSAGRSRLLLPRADGGCGIRSHPGPERSLGSRPDDERQVRQKGGGRTALRRGAAARCRCPGAAGLPPFTKTPRRDPDRVPREQEHGADPHRCRRSARRAPRGQRQRASIAETPTALARIAAR